MDKKNAIYGLHCICSDECTVRGIEYVGLTTLLVGARFREHLRNSRKGEGSGVGSLPVYRWIRKHGETNIRVRTLEECSDPADLNEAEVRWIASLGTFTPDGLNMTRGGGGKWGYRHSEETKRQISRKKIGRPGVSKSGLTEDQVLEIRARMWNGETQSELATEYGVSRKTMKDISQNKVKLHVPWPIGPRQKMKTNALRARQLEGRGRDELGRVVKLVD